MCVYIYIKGSCIYKHTTQQIHSIQKCLIQHAYTKKFDYTICFKENTHQELQQNVQQLPSTRKAIRTTQPEKRKRESDE